MTKIFVNLKQNVTVDNNFLRFGRLESVFYGLGSVVSRRVSLVS